HVGYLICSAGSCENGFRASDSSLNVIGGTSGGTPVFAGIVALINQRMNARQGNVNPGLYTVAAVAPHAFYYVANGAHWMPCRSGSTGCSRGVIGYTAGRGYDLASGLGSIDAFKLVTTWPLVLSPR